MLPASQVHSFTGQMAEWVSTFLEAPVSLIDLINDTHALGAAHDPAAFMKRPRETDVRSPSVYSRLSATNLARTLIFELFWCGLVHRSRSFGT